MPSDRRQARILAMQALCQWDVQRNDARQALDDFLAAQESSKEADRYAAELVKAFWSQREKIDQRIAGASLRWDLARISPVERNIMRVAIVELLGDKVPPKVALNEAIEIGREFGGEDSPRFINGVLDEVLQTLPLSRRF